jgi:hypothetical protein
MKTDGSIVAQLIVITCTGLLTQSWASATRQANLSFFLTTGVYSGFCNNEITTGVLQFGEVALYGLGSNIDPTCQNNVPTQPLPIAIKGYLGNLAVASTENQPPNNVPSTVTLYVNGNATDLSCTVDSSTPTCVDHIHKVSVGPQDSFALFATCNPTSNCAQSLQVTVDRLQRVTVH